MQCLESRRKCFDNTLQRQNTLKGELNELHNNCGINVPHHLCEECEAFFLGPIDVRIRLREVQLKNATSIQKYNEQERFIEGSNLFAVFIVHAEITVMFLHY